MEIELLGNLKNPSVLVIGVFHGDEPQGAPLIRAYLKNNPNTKLLMIPCLNKSGMELNKRTNANGVDLNRNFPTKNWGTVQMNAFYGGKSPASEEETRFVIDTVEQYKPEIILTLHAPYEVVNYDGPGEEIAQKIADIIGYPVEPSIGYPTPGSFGTWAGVERNIPIITLELSEDAGIKALEKPVTKIFEMLEDY